jgi:hypothetical protein
MPYRLFILYPNPEVVCTLHSQASYWFSIGFKQMVFTVPTCYWFLGRCFGFTKPEAFFPLNITTGSLVAQSFFHVNNYFFSIFWDILIASYEFATKNLKSFL